MRETVFCVRPICEKKKFHTQTVNRYFPGTLTFIDFLLFSIYNDKKIIYKFFL